jgi:hypothetical protein
MALFKNIHISCYDATFLMEKGREHKLTISEWIGLKLHLLYCGFCKLFLKQTKAIEQQMKKNAMAANADQAPFALSIDRKALIKRVLDEQMKKNG